jgi:hypothetical protein
MRCLMPCFPTCLQLATSSTHALTLTIPEPLACIVPQCSSYRDSTQEGGLAPTTASHRIGHVVGDLARQGHSSMCALSA